MSTDSTYKGLYKGDPDVPAGQAIKRMLAAGRSVSLKERDRWQENRLMYRGEQWSRAQPGANRVHQLARQRGQNRARDTFNRLRQFTDGRVAILTAQKPPFEVIPNGRDQDMIDAARQAKKLIAAKWGEAGWNVDSVLRQLALTGEVDGISFLCVNFDPTKGKVVNYPFDNQTGKPIVERTQIEAMRQQDPHGQVLWTNRRVGQGEVVFRVVRAGALAVDPMVTSEWNPRWVIESRLRSIEDIEEISGKKIADIRGESAAAMGVRSDDGFTPSSVTDEDGTGQSYVSEEHGLIVHEAFITKGRKWPHGAHCMLLDQAPGTLILAEPWEGEIPYRPFVPRPDGSHIIRSRGTVDELKPIQIYLNRLISLVREWVDRLARQPVLMPFGAMQESELYNDKGYVEILGVGEPHFMPHPSEPTALLSNYIGWCIEQMAEIAVQNRPSRGLPPGQGMESAVGANLLIQQTEQQLSGTAAQFVGVLEWGLSRALRLVGRHYSIPRLVSTPGVDDEVEFQEFVGSQLRGCEDVRVTGSILPRLRAAQIQTIMELIPILGPDIRPWVARLVEGDLDEFVAHEEAQAQRQKRENKQMAVIGSHPARDQVWADFQQAMAGYEKAKKLAAEQMVEEAQAAAGMSPGNGEVPGEMGAGMGAPPPALPPRHERPEDILLERGIVVPRVTEALRAAGVRVPRVEKFDVHPTHMLRLDDWRVSDGYEEVHPLVRQVAEEHADDHLAGVGKQLAAMGRQQGAPSSMAPKGQPSPPKEPGTPGGQAGQSQMSGGMAA